jgi:hypothetical protein
MVVDSKVGDSESMGTRYWSVYESDVNDVVLAKLEGYSEVF